MRFFGLLRHSKGEWAGKPLVLTPWQGFVVGSVFGWLRKDGTRRFRTVYQEVPRKNGKSTMLAGIGLYMLVADGEPGAEIYAAATKKEQARIIFDEAKRMVRSSSVLGSRVRSYKLNLSIERTSSKFEPLSADEKTLDGLNPSAVLIDELHKHRNRGVLDMMDTGMGSRRQPVLWIITTAGDDNPESVYAHENDYATKVLEGTLEDDTLLAFISTIDKDDRWDDPAAWAKANPNIGVSVKLDDLHRQADKAKRSPTAQAAFKRYRLNVRTSDDQRAIDMALWSCNTLGRIDPESLKGRECFVGLDLSSKIDITAAVRLFAPSSPGERWKLLARFWIPADNITEREDRDRAPYRRWIDDGWVEPTLGNIVDHESVFRTVLWDARDYPAIEIAYDPWNATQMAVQLQNEGVRMIEFIQGLRSYTAPTKELLAMLQAERLDHGENPVLTWMASNLHVQTDKNENMMPTKKTSRGRIDGITALAMAIGRAQLADGREMPGIAVL